MTPHDPNLRIGQELYIFLRWLSDTKYVRAMSDSGIADPFNISDDQWNEWFAEFRALNPPTL